jgi:YD repeat-containing protein
MFKSTLASKGRQFSKALFARAVMLFALGGVLLLCSAGSGYGQQPETVTYTYDSLNRLTSATYSSGVSIVYTYDAAGNRTSLQVSGSTAAAALSISNISPRAGRAAGGQQIKLTGSFANLYSLNIGGTATQWSFTNGTSEITVTTPQHAVGAVNIELVPTAGNTYTQSNAFAFLPTTFTDNTLAAGVTTVKAQHILELRQAVDALRAAAGLPPAPWTDPVLTPTFYTSKAQHILELRTYLEEAASRLGYTAQSYTDPSLTPAVSVIRKLYIEELRQRIRAIAG